LQVVLNGTSDLEYTSPRLLRDCQETMALAEKLRFASHMQEMSVEYLLQRPQN